MLTDGTTILITEESYDSCYHLGMFRVERAFSPQEILDNFFKGFEVIGMDRESNYQDAFISFLVREGYLMPIGGHKVLSLWHFEPRAMTKPITDLL